MKKEIIVINIGKNGVSDNIITEIKTLFKKYKKIKIKFLKNSPDRNNFSEVIEKIIQQTSAKLKNKKGFTLEIYKE